MGTDVLHDAPLCLPCKHFRLESGYHQRKPDPYPLDRSGATQALPILKTRTRHIAGLVEVELAKHIADKTNWRAMLKGDNEQIDLDREARRLLQEVATRLNHLNLLHGWDAIQMVQGEPVEIEYPVQEHPEKVTSFNFDKQPEVSGILKGIKGQYLILDSGVINLRKFTSYEVDVD